MSASMKKTPAFIAHVSSFSGVEDVFLVLANQATISWLIDQLTQVACITAQSSCLGFALGNGNPIESDGQCIVVADLRDDETAPNWFKSHKAPFVGGYPANWQTGIEGFSRGC